jgi:hypothetical protein
VCPRMGECARPLQWSVVGRRAGDAHGRRGMKHGAVDPTPERPAVYIAGKEVLVSNWEAWARDDRSFVPLRRRPPGDRLPPDEVTDCHCSICRRYGAL